MKKIFWLIAAFFLTGCASSKYQPESIERKVSNLGSETPLFLNQTPLEVVLTSDFPFGGYYTQEKLEKYPKYDGTIEYYDNGQKIISKIKLQARGSGRLHHCQFAPIKLFFSKGENKQIFEGAGKDFKIVTHCNAMGNSENSTTLLLKELLMYKMIESLQIPSFKTRALKISYRRNDGSLVTDQFAFIIEPTENLISRYENLDRIVEDNLAQTLLENPENKGKQPYEVVRNFMASKVDANSFVQNSFAQLLILNDDWGGAFRSPNSKAFYTKDGKVIDVHYDFDLSHLVGKSKRERMFKYPNTLQNDIEWLTAFCKTNTEDTVNPEEIKKYCATVRNQFLDRKSNVVKAIVDFQFLAPSEKEDIYKRVQIYFEALQKLNI